MKYIKLLLLLLLMAEVQTTFGQGWVVSGSYTYDMTVTAVLNVNCVEMTNPSNQIAAFINGEVRGVALSSTVVKGRYVALLTIRSNMASSENVSFKIYNAATGNITNAVTKVLFQDDAVYGTPSDPYDIRTNSAPANLALPNKSIAEGNMPQPISAITVSDADIADTHTYSLVSGTGSTDNSSFVILGNQLFSNGALNYDLKTKYKIRVQAADNNGCSISDSFTITVTDRNFPATDILISNNTIDENKAIGSVVGVLTSVDQDKTDVFTYTLVSGVGADDNSKFVINGNSLTSNTVFDYEVKAAYTIRVQTKDAGNNTFEKIVSIGVNNINDKPNVNDNTLGVEEYALNGKILGTMSGSDADIGQTLTYSFINTPPQTIFGINSATGEISLLSNTLNYQTTKFYTLKVIALDNGSPALSDTATLTIQVVYQNFAPTDISINKTTVKENSLAGTKAGEFGTYDKNIEDVFTYSLVNGLDADDNGSFTISGNSLLTSSVFDYETKASYKIRVQTKDAGNNTFEKTFTISVDNVNDKPTINDKTLGVEEYASSNFIFGSITAIDADAGQTLTYSFINTPPQTVFGINSATGEVSLLSNTLNYQTTKFYTLKVVALDNGSPALSDTATLTIQVVYQNFPPTDISINKTTVKENSLAGTKVGEFGTYDKNIEDVFTYSLVNGLDADDNGSFTISGNSLLTSSVFDYETKASYKIRIQTKDAGNNIFEETFTISVDNVNDKPTINDKTLGVEEYASSNFIFGSITAIDADAGQTLTYSFINTPPQTVFGINSTTGEVSLLSNTLNYQTTKFYTLKVVALDNGSPALSDTSSLTIQVVYQNFSPTDISISKTTVKENSFVGTKVGEFGTYDKNIEDVFTYSLVNGLDSDDNGRFVINGNSLLTSSVFDYETKASYKIRVQTKDAGNNTFEKSFTISIDNVNDKPNFIDKTLGVEEKAVNGKVLGIMTGSDADVGQTLTYSLINTPPQTIFGINATTGEVSLLSNTLNYQLTQSYTIQVIALDNGTPALSDTAALRIIVLYQNYAPTDISISNRNIKENISLNTKIADLASFDKNDGDVFTYTLVDGVSADDNGSFVITGNGLYTNSLVDYESKTTYNIRVQTKDLSGNTFQKPFVINVTDVNEQPQMQDQIMTIDEAAIAGTVLGRMEAVNEDRFQTLAFYIVNIGVPQSTFKIDQSTGDISLLTGNLNYATTQSYTLKIAVKDSGIPSLSDTATLKILVSDKNYPPTVLLISNDNINENKPANSTVAVFSSTDLDIHETFTYTLVSGANSSDNGKFLIKGDSLLTKSSLNYEAKPTYTIRVQTKDSGGNTLEESFTILVNDLNETPKLTSQTVGVEENAGSGKFIVKMTAVDEDNNQHLTYSFIGSSSAQNTFRIDPVTGEITLNSNALDYEKVKSYTLNILVVDDGEPILSDTATLSINVLDVVENTLASVDYVSANGDGKNDYWVIENVSIYSEYSLMIFDANGIMVYKVDGGYDNSWNGLYNGAELPIGAYYYVLSSSDKSKSFKGTISLVR